MVNPHQSSVSQKMSDTTTVNRKWWKSVKLTGLIFKPTSTNL